MVLENHFQFTSELQFFYANVLYFVILAAITEETKLKLNSVAFGPRANYADRATAASWRSSANFLRIEGVAWSAQRIPPVVN
jgi:hypothetical protein